MTTTDAIVVGGSVGGLATAIGLARAGHSVVVIEPRTDVAPRDRWGYTLWPPAVRALTWLGVGDAVAARGTQLAALRWYSGQAREWLSYDTARVPGRFLGVLPSQVLAVLDEAARAAGVEVLRGVRFTDVIRDARGVEIITDGVVPRRLRARVAVAADGPESPVRTRLGVPGLRFRPFRQVIHSGIGGESPASESWQALSHGWSVGSVALGAGRSWVYAVVTGSVDPHTVLASHAAHQPRLQRTLGAFPELAPLRPCSMRITRWAVDRVVLVGDAAHPILPHLGLGGSQTLEDVPVLVDVLTDALRRDDLSERALSAFEARRIDRVAFARRASDLWALACCGGPLGLGILRDFNLRRLARHPELMDQFLNGVASGIVPSLWTRLSVWLP